MSLADRKELSPLTQGIKRIVRASLPLLAPIVVACGGTPDQNVANNIIHSTPTTTAVEVTPTPVSTETPVPNPTLIPPTPTPEWTGSVPVDTYYINIMSDDRSGVVIYPIEPPPSKRKSIEETIIKPEVENLLSWIGTTYTASGVKWLEIYFFPSIPSEPKQTVEGTFHTGDVYGDNPTQPSQGFHFGIHHDKSGNLTDMTIHPFSYKHNSHDYQINLTRFTDLFHIYPDTTRDPQHLTIEEPVAYIPIDELRPVAERLYNIPLGSSFVWQPDTICYLEYSDRGKIPRTEQGLKGTGLDNTKQYIERVFISREGYSYLIVAPISSGSSTPSDTGFDSCPNP